MSRNRTVVLVPRPPGERRAFYEGRIASIDERIEWLRAELARSLRIRKIIRRLARSARRGKDER